MVRILDCTLRDGGYCNNWMFGAQCIYSMVERLEEANIDIIECGFLTNKVASNPASSQHSTLDDIRNALPPKNDKCIRVAMVNYGEYNIGQLENRNSHSPVDGFRVAFHKKDREQAMDFCRSLAAKGYLVFIQAMVSQNYNDEEFRRLIEECNAFNPYAFYIVDSFGMMTRDDVLHYAGLATKYLNKEVCIGFHSHNNLQQSFSNTQALLDFMPQCNVIIDASVDGMGRGAGNLCTELLAKYLNEKFGQHYQMLPILEIVDLHINPIFQKNPWGYSVAYYVAAAQQCHPNYATYLIEKQTVGVRDINTILSQLTDGQKKQFDQAVVEQLYLEHQGRTVAGDDNTERVRQLVAGRKTLVVAPGRSLVTQRDKIATWIDANRPLTVAVNFVPDDLPADVVFVSNNKRSAELGDLSGAGMVVATSNLNLGADAVTVDYTSLYRGDGTPSDNAGIMCLHLLQNAGVTEVYLAGFDGYRMDLHSNYCSDSMILNASMETLTRRNQIVGQLMCTINRSMRLHFLTESLYTSFV
ncbi:MAG: 4-hydroxy 2-oxovalerate aldolase [bacterium P3]|nr:MAG: 4-hydroxy 2-oxovalerate aldolase [bacterium P3]KWW40749.1 MAG: 4-hydroxy 2-oxovalerate aldolase [bacterium F083]